MGDEAKRDPTVQEIVVALRETRFGGMGRGMAVVAGGEDPEYRPPARARLRRAADEAIGAEVGVLRDEEIRRLAAENARLNERIAHLLSIIEREQGRRQHEAIAELSEAAVARAAREVVEAQLRPLLLAVLRMLERQAGGTAPEPLSLPPASRTKLAIRPVLDSERAAAPRARAPAPQGAEPAPQAGYYPGWVHDLIRTVDPSEAATTGDSEAATPQASPNRTLIGRLLDRIRSNRRKAHES